MKSRRFRCKEEVAQILGLSPGKGEADPVQQALELLRGLLSKGDPSRHTAEFLSDLEECESLLSKYIDSTSGEDAEAANAKEHRAGRRRGHNFVALLEEMGNPKPKKRSQQLAEKFLREVRRRNGR